MPTFSTRLIQWQRQHGRNNLPWQTRDAYRVWLSEIMLQQTQVATVLDYYPRFLTAFPTVQALAAASQDQVLSLWAGLGYYSRARNLHAAAQQIVQQHGGAFPSTRAELETLKGVGRSTAAAIAAFAYHQREAILDGNVKRVLCRVFAQDGNPANKAFDRQLWALPCARAANPAAPNAQCKAFAKPTPKIAPPNCHAKNPPPPCNSKRFTGLSLSKTMPSGCTNARSAASGQACGAPPHSTA